MIPSLPPHDRPPTDAPLVQFRLRHLLIAVAAVCVLSTTLAAVGGYARLVLLMAVAIVLAHVLATTVGLRLKQNAIRRRNWHLAHGTPDPEESASRGPMQRTKPDPPGPLGDHVSRLPWLPILVACAAITGGVAGGIVLSATIGHRITLAGLALGSLSTAALAAWMMLVLGGFVGMSRHAWRHATGRQGRESIKRRV